MNEHKEGLALMLGKALQYSDITATRYASAQWCKHYETEVPDLDMTEIIKGWDNDVMTIDTQYMHMDNIADVTRIALFGCGLSRANRDTLMDFAVTYGVYPLFQILLNKIASADELDAVPNITEILAIRPGNKNTNYHKREESVALMLVPYVILNLVDSVMENIILGRLLESGLTDAVHTCVAAIEARSTTDVSGGASRE